jgi:hypothetical protein
MYNECRVAHPACNDGNAPNTTGDAENDEVYNFVPKRVSIRSNPPGDPFME